MPGKQKEYTLEEITIRGNEIHNNEYEYIEIFRKLNKKGKSFLYIKAKCSKGHIFIQAFKDHLRGHGCIYCGDCLKSNTEEFIEKANKIFGDEYDYDLVDYVNAHVKVTIKHKKCGTVFLQPPNSHLAKHGCPTCGGTGKLTTEIFIKKSKEIHGNLYDYSLVDYVNNSTKVKIICPHGHIFEQTPTLHLRGNGCYECSGRKKITKEKFIEIAKLIHGDKYDYSLVIYVTTDDKVKIICNRCENIFEQTPYHHTRRKQGCPDCSITSTSKPEIDWLNEQNIPEQNRQITIKIKNKNYRVDAYIPETNTIYEFFGDFWHGNPEIFKLEDINPRNGKTYKKLYEETLKRLKLFEDNGHKVIYIWENNYKKQLRENKNGKNKKNS